VKVMNHSALLNSDDPYTAVKHIYSGKLSKGSSFFTTVTEATDSVALSSLKQEMECRYPSGSGLPTSS